WETPTASSAAAKLTKTWSAPKSKSKSVLAVSRSHRILRSRNASRSQREEACPVFLRLSCVMLVLGLLAFLSAGTVGQEKDKEAPPEKQGAKKQIRKADEDYRRFFKPPQRPLEFWAAIKFEIEVG